MGTANVLSVTTLLLILEACSVLGQARVEFINQPYSTPTISSAPVVQSPPQLLVPTIIKSVPQETYVQENIPAPMVPSFNNYGGYSGYLPSMPPPMPPIIIEESGDDNWHNLLYFLIFALKNKRCGGSGGCGGCGGGCRGKCGGGCGGSCGGFGYKDDCGYGGGCGGNCGNFGGYGCGGNSGGSCGGGCSGFNNGGCGCGGGNANNGFFIPYPIAVPMNGCFGGFGGFGIPDNSCGYVEEPTCTTAPNEINLIIRTDGGSC